MACAFGELLYDLIARSGSSVSEFAAKAGIHQPHLSAIRHGQRPAPLKHLGDWADLLELSGEERERFMDLGAMTHCPERIQEMVREIENSAGKTLRELGEQYRAE